MIDENLQILNGSANLQKYLFGGDGDFQNDIIKMAAPSLRTGLRAAISEARKNVRRVDHEGMSVKVGDQVQSVMVTVQPLPQMGDGDMLFLVVFQDVGLPIERGSDSRRDLRASDGSKLLASSAANDKLIEQLESELETTRSDLEHSVRELEAANEELKSSNEELLSINEEMQSANAELERSKEEIRAVSDAVARASDDLENLLRSSQIATVFLDEHLQIRSFTPAIAEIYSLVPTDIGRPLEEFVPNVFDMPPLPDPTTRALEHTVLAHSGKSYIRRVLPYQSHTRESEGIVVTFTDVTQLRESEELFQLLVDASAQIVWVTSADGEVIDDSPSWRAFTGQTFDEWVGFGWANAIHPDDREPTQQAWQAVVKARQPLSIEYRLYHKESQQYRWMLVRAFPQRSSSGTIKRWVGMNTDIANRKLRELELADREAHLRRVIDNMLGFVGVLDTDGNLVEANQTALVAGGVRRDEVIGKKFWDCVWWNYDPAISQQLRNAFENVLTGETVRYDVVVRMAGDMRIAIDFMLVPVRDSEGRITHVIPSGVDINDRKCAERELKLSAERLSVAAQAAGFGMLNVDLEAGTVEFSPELKYIVGYADAHEFSLVPGELPPFIHPDDAKSLMQHYRQGMLGCESQESMAFNHRIVRPDGETRWVRLQTRTIYSHSNDATVARPSQIFGTLLDITQQHQFEEQLKAARDVAEAANRSKSAFVANMSHEIRTPMTAILGYADLIRDMIEHPDAVSHLQTIRRNGAYLLEIINDILDLSKIEAGKLDIEYERFEPVQLIEDVRSVMEVRATEGGLKLDVEYDGMLPQVIESDAKRLKQILINLVGNAIKFTKSGRVNMRVRYDSGIGLQPVNAAQDTLETYPALTFDIIDTGIGMNEDQMERLFKPFSQGDSSINRHFGGTGLGLAISQRLAAMLGGEIRVSSTADVGSTFTVSIAIGKLQDVALVDCETVTHEESKHSLQPSPGSMALNCHVLVVDDRRDIRFLSKRLLTKAGATVDECEDGQLAVDHVASLLANRRKPSGDALEGVRPTAKIALPDLILLDMQMPNLDGYQTARKLRVLGYSGPIIALTADAMHGDMNECIEAGCNDYLSKPIDSNKLVELVGKLTNRKDS